MIGAGPNFVPGSSSGTATAPSPGDPSHQSGQLRSNSTDSGPRPPGVGPSAGVLTSVPGPADETPVPVEVAEEPHVLALASDQSAHLDGDHSTAEPVHLSKGSSSVACGRRMRHWKTNPDGWDLSTSTTAAYEVTCEACLATFTRVRRTA